MDFASTLIARINAPGTDRASFARQCMSEFDRNEDGAISAHEFQQIFASLQRTQEISGSGSSSFVASGCRPTLFAVTLFPSYSNHFAVSAYQATAMLDAFDQDGDNEITFAELEAKPPEAETPEAEPTPAPDNTTETSDESEALESDAALSATERADQLLALYDLTQKGYITIDDIVSAWLKDPTLGDIANAGNAIEAWDMNGDQKISRDDIIAAYAVMDAADMVIAAFDGTETGSFALAMADDETLATLDLSRDQIQSWDQDRDGILTRAELIDGMKLLNIEAAADAERAAFEALLTRYDANQDGTINPDELRAALGDVTFDEAALQSNFAAWDRDQNGGIDAAELRLGFAAIEEAKTIIATYDQDGKGYFDAADLQRAIDTSPNPEQSASAAELLTAWDRDGDGRVSVQDVLIMQEMMKAASTSAVAETPES